MEKKLVPTHRYKTSVVFYDDNLCFLEFLQNNLVSDRFDFYFVSNLNEFEQTIADSNIAKKYLPDIINHLDNELNDLDDHAVFEFDLSKFEHIKNNASKNKEIGLVFIDNELDKSNGIEISSKLEHGIQKVLLTGACDLESAIQALNEKSINMFIDKLDNNLINKIYEVLEHFINNYFVNKNYYNNSKLSNQHFYELFKSITTQYNIIEHYLVAKDSFLLIDAGGTQRLFKFWDDDDFNKYYDLHHDSLNNANNEKLLTMKTKKQIPVGELVLDSRVDHGVYYCIVENHI